MEELGGTSNCYSGAGCWRVRLFQGERRGATPLGAGVLLPGGLVLTCAHVVLARRTSAGPPLPLEDVYAEFPGVPAALRGPVAAKVLDRYLRPPTSRFSADIALLQLAEEPPVTPAVLHRQIPAREERVHLIGYPERLPGGEHADAKLMGRGGPGHDTEWVQLDPEPSSPYVVAHGYSGSGVVHSRTGGVIGILVYQYGTEQHPVTASHSYMIPTETILAYLADEKLTLQVTGVHAVADSIRLEPGAAGSDRALGLRRWLARWLGDTGPSDPDTLTGADSAGSPGPRRPADQAEPVELAFVAEGAHDETSALHSALLLADRERKPWLLRSGEATVMEPRAGSIDIALDATDQLPGQLVRYTAARAGLTAAEASATGAPTDDLAAVTRRIAAKAPPLSAAFLSLDRLRPAGESVLPLLRALLARGHSRLLLVFRAPRGPLLDRVVGELLDDRWAGRHKAAIDTRLALLARLEDRDRPADGGPAGPRKGDGPQPVSPLLAQRLSALCQGGEPRNSASVAYGLFRIAVAVEDALQRHGLPGAPRRYNVDPPGDGLTDLPHITVGNPDSLVGPAPEVSGPGPGPGPKPLAARWTGLVSGQELHQQYRVVGRLGQGSYGQVYLARDQMLDDRPVALKGVRDPDDPRAVDEAVKERLRLVGLNHPSIIKVFNYARRPGASDGNLSFIVMEFADGAPLSWIADRIARRAEPFHDHRVHEFIAVYGLLILDALTYLHEECKLVYGDLSLTNVIHCGTGIKLIDVAGVRPTGTLGSVTYPAPELGLTTAVTVPADLYTVGAVLGELAARVPEAPPGLGTRSLAHVLHRATARIPAERFADAREMAVQLRGVLRELRSLRLGEEAVFEPSSLFAPAPAALDGELGKAPPLGQWRDGSNVKRGLTVRPPAPAEVALGLPVPKPDVADGNWTELHRTSYDDPASLLQLSDAWKGSAEKALLHLRLHLEIARDHPEDAAARRAFAETELARARVEVGGLAAYDWRLHWHEGLLHLVDDRVAAARGCFARVYAAIPGEYAPKLALGYCHEVLDDPAEAVALYGAVWHRNHALGSAAFGLARIHLADAKPQLALECLEAVPVDSRHRTAARTAMVRILADPPADGSPPAVPAVREAWLALHRLTVREGLTDRHAQDRLRADLLELLLLLVTATPSGAPDPLAELRVNPDPQGEKITVPSMEHALREELAACYLRLFEQLPPAARARDRALAEALLDNAYRTRPIGYRHRRGDQRPRWFRRFRRFRLKSRSARSGDASPPSADTVREGAR
ncbi:tetratricopeptide repeat protein [Streptomyces rimosus]|uniref:tetratricopeptide repeat protein n=1 Tax=Streptomyces rimosus TaxID=1927 RepID=UPI00067B5564|nr:tetratricopeptide repeat protein [Streptomyces rimosus]